MSTSNNKAIIIAGSPATGKSTYARLLAQKTAAVLLDLDTCTERLIQAALRAANKDPNDRDSQYYKETYREVVYETLFDIAKENLAHQSVIIVGPFTKELQDQNWPNILKQRLDCLVEVHYLYCKPEVRKSRMLKRANPRDQRKFENWEEINKYYLKEQSPAFDCVLIDTSSEL